MLGHSSSPTHLLRRTVPGNVIVVDNGFVQQWPSYFCSIPSIGVAPFNEGASSKATFPLYIRGTVDAQRSGSIVAYIHIGDAVMHQCICEAVTFVLP